jgi:serine/threonine-protein kinase
VIVEEQGRVHTIARMERHTVVGEMAFVTHEARSASVVAASRGSAATIGKADFERIAGRYPRLSVALSELMAERVGTLSIDVLCGKSIGRYAIRQRLGRGAMGIVYGAAEESSGRPVALKMLRHDLTLDRLATQRFHQEAEIVRELQHPNIVQVFERFSAFGTSFIAMELCDGPSLGDLIAHVGPLSESVVRAVTGQIAAGLAKAHRAGVAHRDLKPSNVLFTRAGTAKLADFGLARCLSTDLAALTAYGQIVGTPRYMAPEQLSGERGDARSDLYALGCMVYEALVGHPLYRSERFNALLKERALWSMPESNAIRPRLEPRLYELLRQSLEEDPDMRSVDLEELAEWAAPVDLAALGVVCPATESGDAAPGTATVRDGGGAA